MKKQEPVLILLGIFSMFIVYGTVIPLDFQDIPFAINKLHQALLFSFGNFGENEIISRAPDIVQNVLLFLPVGMLGKMLLKPDCSSIRVYIIVTLYGIILSTIVETLQLFSLTRDTSIVDILTNGCGTLTGIIIMGYVPAKLGYDGKKIIKQLLIHQKLVCHYVLVLAAIVAAALLPFDFSLDGSSVLPKIQSLNKTIAIQELISTADYWLASLYIMLIIMTLQLSRKINGKTRLLLLGSVFVLPTVLESMQILVVSRIPEVNDCAVNYLALMIGFVLWLFVKNSNRLYRWSSVAVLLCGLIAKNIVFPYVHSEYLIMNTSPNVPEHTRATMFYLGNFFDTFLMLLISGYLILWFETAWRFVRVSLFALMLIMILYWNYHSDMVVKPLVLMLQMVAGFTGLVAAYFFVKKEDSLLR